MDALSRLADALRCLPGIGPKSALRMTCQLLQQRQRGLHLAKCLVDAMENIHHCTRCNNYTEETLCRICRLDNRSNEILCVVESPADVSAIEQSHAFSGTYFVLMGKISPLDGIGPGELRLPLLRERVLAEQTREVILALSPTVEGQTTAHFIHELLKDIPVRISEPARGIPSGGELEFLDSGTIGNALRNRALLQSGASETGAFS
ncbi:recombination protein RecR [Legionella geestiana]|uniref:recombination mediator RecR n=1 Tax=Legionella geestiana TaxID=45065 RepID=UPI00109292D7|nr:recombination mediator RecR [Legionella geestiana]QDQ40412.1 recombination protein RecR [Legionella geestiana]